MRDPPPMKVGEILTNFQSGKQFLPSENRLCLSDPQQRIYDMPWIWIGIQVETSKNWRINSGTIWILCKIIWWKTDGYWRIYVRIRLWAVKIGLSVLIRFIFFEKNGIWKKRLSDTSGYFFWMFAGYVKVYINLIWQTIFFD